MPELPEGHPMEPLFGIMRMCFGRRATRRRLYRDPMGVQVITEVLDPFITKWSEVLSQMVSVKQAAQSLEGESLAQVEVFMEQADEKLHDALDLIAEAVPGLERVVRAVVATIMSAALRLWLVSLALAVHAISHRLLLWDDLAGRGPPGQVVASFPVQSHAPPCRRVHEHGLAAVEAA